MTSYLRHSTAMVSLALGATLACGSDSGGTAPPDGTVGVGLAEVASGLSFPVYVTAPPGDADRLFIVEKGGAIRIVKEGRCCPTRSSTSVPWSPPAASRDCWVWRSTPTTPRTAASWCITPTPPATPGFRPSFARLPTPTWPIRPPSRWCSRRRSRSRITTADNCFRPGRLPLSRAWAMADRAEIRTAMARTWTELLGSILRLDVRTAVLLCHPGRQSLCRKHHRPPRNLELRPPKPLAVQLRPGHRRSLIGDVGQNLWEEVDVSPQAEGAGRGVNFGWNVMEGTHCYAAGGCDQTGLALPRSSTGTTTGAR